MELREEKDRWVFHFVDGRVNSIHVDFRLTLDLVDGPNKASLTIETPCRLKGPNVDVALKPSEPSSLAPILFLFNAKVIAAVIEKTGHLKVEFEGSRFVEVEPDDSYEAWQIDCSIGVMFVCSPGGSVSFFRDAKTPAKAT
jgi:hypothetical protein